MEEPKRYAIIVNPDGDYRSFAALLAEAVRDRIKAEIEPAISSAANSFASRIADDNWQHDFRKIMEELVTSALEKKALPENYTLSDMETAHANTRKRMDYIKTKAEIVQRCFSEITMSGNPQLISNITDFIDELARPSGEIGGE